MNTVRFRAISCNKRKTFFAVSTFSIEIKNMKNILVLLALCISVISYGQTNKLVPSPNTNPTRTSQFGPFLNLSNSAATGGREVSYGTLYLTSGFLNGTTPTIYPINGRGVITLTTVTWHASATSTVNPTVVSTPQGSFDGYVWVNIPSLTASTLTPTATYSSTVQPTFTATWELADNYFLYYRVKHSVTNDTASVQDFYYLNKTYSLTGVSN